MFKKSKSHFINIFPQNPTQTRYFRFLKGPDSEIKTMFTESVSKFTQGNEKRLKTRYTKFLGDLK